MKPWCESQLKLFTWGALSLSVVSLGLGAPRSAQAEVYHVGVSLAGQHFAADSPFSSKFSIEGEIRSEENLVHDSRIPHGEFHLYSFFEGDADSRGDISLDIDATALRGNLGSYGHFWFGRTQPFSEGAPSSPAIRSTSAIGASWVQNQANALDPRVSGWIGGGVHLKLADTGVFTTVGLSPLFLPSFGPRLTFSDKEDTQGARFAKLPPLQYNYNGELFPMRYTINTGSLKNIVLQPQYLAAVGHQSKLHRLTGFFWSAPMPDPKVASAGKLQVSSKSGVNVMVTAVPSFPREYFLGLRWEVPGFVLRPDITIVQEFQSHRTIYSASITPLPYLSLGWLDTKEPSSALQPDATGVVAPRYARNLVWGEVSAPWKISPSFRMEQHLTERTQGFRMRPGLSYQASQNLVVAWSAEILGGQEGSWFGAWRSLDSTSLGARYQW